MVGLRVVYLSVNPTNLRAAQRSIHRLCAEAGAPRELDKCDKGVFRWQHNDNRYDVTVRAHTTDSLRFVLFDDDGRRRQLPGREGAKALRFLEQLDLVVIVVPRFGRHQGYPAQVLAELLPSLGHRPEVVPVVFQLDRYQNNPEMAAPHSVALHTLVELCNWPCCAHHEADSGTGEGCRETFNKAIALYERTAAARVATE